jgi:hypothetical protein
MIPLATWALWEAAGQPLHADAEPYAGPCWWCGLPAPGHGRPQRRAVADTFPDARFAARPDASHVCAACGWTLSERCLVLPADYAAGRLRGLYEQGRRATLSIRGGVPAKRLLLALADGTVGLWSLGKNAAAEKGWMEAREALRTEPVDVWPCAFLEAVPVGDLAAGPTEVFRNFHHYIDRSGRWQVATDSDKPTLRALLLDPPTGQPFTCVIGDGQKHATLYAPACTPEPGGPVAVYHLPREVVYRPAELDRVLEAVEALILAGAGDEEIRADAYQPRGGLDWIRASRRWRPVVAPLRHAALLDLALYLRRPVAVLRESAEIPAPPPVAATPPPTPAPPKPVPTDGIQLRLF